MDLDDEELEYTKILNGATKSKEIVERIKSLRYQLEALEQENEILREQIMQILYED